MKFDITYQESYSRGELLLRTLFGAIYIAIPHGIALFFVGIWGAILQFVSFWIVLFSGMYPRSMFDYQVGLLSWSLRVQTRFANIADGYPAFGLKGNDEHMRLEIIHPERLNRGLLLLRLFFGAIYIYIPHMFILSFRAIWVGILSFISWWAVLFTGKYPKYAFDWVSGTIRWQIRLYLYTGFMTDKYPAFTGEPLPEEAF